MTRSAAYERSIAPLAPGYDPRHVEAFMRLGHPTLDGLYPDQFAEEVAIARAAVDEVGVDEAEDLARSYGY